MAVRKKTPPADRSAPAGKPNDELVKYVFVELDVAREDHQAFQQRMPNLVELMFDHKRWDLVFASYPITGPVNRFVHIWKIPDESTLVEVMRDGAVDLKQSERPPAGSLDAEFRECYLDVQKLIRHTEHRLLTALPYDPTHVGFQSQTVLIDTEGEAFLIDHARLRAEAERENSGIEDIAEELEDVRRAKFTRRSRVNKEMPKDPDAEKRVAALQKKPGGQTRVASLVEVQMHLNRGSVAANLKFMAERALLFNLASLKAKSVYQAIGKRVDPKKAPKLAAAKTKRNGNGNGRVDVSERLLLAMPWGGIYDVKKTALRSLVGAVPRKFVRSTKKALKPLQDAGTPVAAIPEERDDVIGDGCACYVINLKSFVK